MDARIPTIVKIAKQLNDKGIRYAIGGSVLLYLKGIDFSFNDLDLMIHEEDALKVREALKEIGEYHPNNRSTDAKVFDEFTIEGLDVDAISGLSVTAYGKTYDFSFKGEEVDYAEVEGVKIPLDSLDRWYDIYSFQGRVEKARYIKDYQLYHKK